LTIVVDASVAVKWFFEESGFQPARALLDTGESLIAPSIVLVEVANAAWKRHRRGEIGTHDARELVRLMDGPFTRIEPLESLVFEAAQLSLQLDHVIYDCLYLALAMQQAAAVATADNRMSELASRLGLKALYLAAE